MVKKIAILGSTGSIGTNALRVIEALGSDYQVHAITANSSAKLLASQALKYSPACVAITDPTKVDEFKANAKSYAGKILTGPEALDQLAESDEVDIVISAVVGAAGLSSTLKAAAAGKILAIANKEPLVIAGHLLMKTAKDAGATVLPIDSEHSAIFQSLQSGTIDEVQRIILTASGGPFRNTPTEKMNNATVKEALAHPTWDMGPKITIDSATMMNKALEVIEAVWLFGIGIDKIDVLIHPQSVIHSMVEYVDSSVIAQLGTPNMAVPIQYALTYPKRHKGIAERINFEELAQLTFEKPDFDHFKALKIGYEVAKTGKTAPAVFNAANEEAVAQFLAGKIKFGQITQLIESALAEHQLSPGVSLGELLAADAWARQHVLSRIM